jgi:hypothetical protein
MMTGHLTPEARDALESYLEEVRSTLRGGELDVEEVIADIRDHVFEALGGNGEEGIDGDGMKAVLRRLGPPSQWLRGEDLTGWRRAFSPADDRGMMRLAAVVFTVTLVGIGAFPWVGPLILLAAWVLARALVAVAASSGRPLGQWVWLIYPPLLLVGLALAGILLLWPVPLLLDAAGGAGPTVRAWAIVAAGVGGWWIVMGWLIRARPQPLRWLMRPLDVRAPFGVLLAVAGLVLAAGAALTLLAT